MDRRRLLRSAAALGVAGALATACRVPGAPPGGDADSMEGVETFRYGDDPSQFAELTRPADPAASRGVVVVVHGGFWLDQYDLSLGRPLAASLAAEGWTAWNLEYRRVGSGGGWPATGDDVSAGIDALADVPDLDLAKVVALGHSAGGHLATWAAGRQRLDAWADARVPLTGVVSQAGVLDLVAADEQGLGGGAVQNFLGAPASSRPDADPVRQVPLDVPVRCVHGTSDGNVPLDQSERYVEAATSAGADATLTTVDGDHFVLIDPRSEAWQVQLELLAAL